MMHPLHQALAQFCADDWVFDEASAHYLGYTITGSLWTGLKHFWVQTPGAKPQPMTHFYEELAYASLPHALRMISQKMQWPERQACCEALIQDMMGKTPDRHWSVEWQDAHVYGYSQGATKASSIAHGPGDMTSLLSPDLYANILQWPDVLIPKDDQDLRLYHRTIFLDVPQTFHERLLTSSPFKEI